MHPRNLSQQVLQVVFSFFLGLVVVAFVGIAVNTVYPEPGYVSEGYDASSWDRWRLVTGVALLVCATVVMVASMLIPDRLPVISNGVLLGGVFTMVYAVGMTLSAANEWPRLVVVAAALLVTVGVGWWRFTSRRSPTTAPASEAAGPASELEERVDALEKTLDGLRRALD